MPQKCTTIFLMPLLAFAACEQQTATAFTDSRDSKTYKWVKIGTQTWMAENLNYDAKGSLCYNGSIANCDKYGRLYGWASAMALPDSCNKRSCSSQISAKHGGICPAGFHIPNNEEWDRLLRYADGTNGTESPYDSPTAGRYLKATNGFSDNGNGLDTYGFAALPGGCGDSDGDFRSIGDFGLWWSASEYDASYAYFRNIYCLDGSARWDYYGKSILFSVRCIRD